MAGPIRFEVGIAALQKIFLKTLLGFPVNYYSTNLHTYLSSEAITIGQFGAAG